MDMVNITCEVIQTAVGFVYVILPVILNQTRKRDCEQSWYSEVCVPVLKLQHYTHSLTHTHDPLVLWLVWSGQESDRRSIVSSQTDWSCDGCKTWSTLHFSMCESASRDSLWFCWSKATQSLATFICFHTETQKWGSCCFVLIMNHCSSTNSHSI